MERRHKVSLVAPEGDIEDIALRHVAIRGNVKGLLCKFVVQHSFHNLGRKPLELIYTFPLSSRAILEKFIVKLGDNLLTSKIMEAKEAEETYEETVIKGDTAVRLEKHRSNIYTLHIGNLGPGEELSVQMHLLESLEVSGGRIKLIFPTVVGPRYIPGRTNGNRTGFGWAEPTDRVPDADWITPPVSVEGVPYRVSMELLIEDASYIKAVESPSHPIRVSQGENSLKVELAVNERANRDIVLTFHVDENAIANRAIAADLGDHKVINFWISPSRVIGETGTSKPLDVQFLLDKSGSMYGEKIEESKKALRLCLRKLRKGDRFNLIAFNHNVRIFSPGWVLFTRENLQEVDEWIDSLQADGGTELYGALRRAFQLEGAEGRERVLVLITDGEVGNEEEIAELFEGYRENLKVLLLGIDTAVNEDLFYRILQTVPGWVEFIYPGEPLEEIVSLQFQRLFAPVLESIEFDSGRMKPRGVFPEPPVILRRDGLTSFIIEFEGDLRDEMEYRLKFKGGEEVNQVLRLNVLGKSEAGTLEKLWAKEKIRELQRYLRRSKIYGDPRERESIEREIVDLALRYQLESAFTQWVAVLERKEKIQEMPRIQVVPVEFPEGWRLFSHRGGFPFGMHDRVAFCLHQVERKVLTSVEDTTSDEDREMKAVISEIFLNQDWDGSFSVGTGDNVINTLTALFILAYLAENNEYDLLPYEANILKALEFLDEHWTGTRYEEALILLSALQTLQWLILSIRGHHSFRALLSRAEALIDEGEKAVEEFEKRVEKVLNRKLRMKDFPRLKARILKAASKS